MEESVKEYRVKYYRSTHPCVMTLSFLLIAYVISRIAAHYTIPHDEKWMVDCAIGLFVLGAGFFYNDRRARIVCVPFFVVDSGTHEMRALRMIRAKKKLLLSQELCVGITYFHGPSPGNYRRRK